MSDPTRCADVRALAPEVAIGVAPVEERARVLSHTASCADCRAFLADLSAVVDDLSALAAAEPPSGFESSVLARIEGHAEVASRPTRRDVSRLLRVAGVIVLVAAASGLAVHAAGRSDRDLAGQLRQTLAVADGQYLVAFDLVDDGGQPRGALLAYQGEPAWVVLTFRPPLADGRHTVELVGRDGTTHRLPGALDPARTPAWASVIPIAVHDASLVRVLDAHGRLAFSTAIVFP